jgi:hypothetical protein
MYNTDLPNRAELPSSKKLMLSTLIAIVVAAVLLVTIVLPSEYGIDPTRIGRVFSLTQMGEIKMRLAEEAKKDREAQTVQTTATQPKQTAPTQPTTNNNSAAKKDEMTVTLKPGEGVEIKLDMTKSAKVVYEWTTNGGVVNHDTHGDSPKKEFISYKKGTSVEKDAGEFTAEFDGSHGWFWRNRTGRDVTIVLKTNGEYQSIKRVA